MWGESSKCETDCQCSRLITENFKINSGNNATKRRLEESKAIDFKQKMNPCSLKFNQSPLSPIHTPKRKVLGELQNSLFKSPSIEKSPSFQNSMFKSPSQNIPLSSLLNSPKLNTPFLKRSTKKISRIFEERRSFKMENKENYRAESFMKFEVNEESRDSAFSENQSPVARGLQKSRTIKDWTLAKMSSESPEPIRQSKSHDFDLDHFEDLDPELDSLHDLDRELECGSFDMCTKYEIISTDSPDIISRGRNGTTKVNTKDFQFGAPIGDSEPSTSFDTKSQATRVLNFEESFDFNQDTKTSVKKSLKFTENTFLKGSYESSFATVKKSLKFSETPVKLALKHENSCSSIGSLSTTSPISTHSSNLKLYPSESMNSMESGFISEMEEPFLDLEEPSNSPKMANFNELLSGTIKNDISQDFTLKRPTFSRSLSYNPDGNRNRVKLSLFGDKKCVKRSEPTVSENECKRRKGNDEVKRPVLQRAYSENAASIISALARSASNPDLIGDFSVPFALPITSGEHSDLKSISCDTVAALIRGDYQDICDYKVIDCRYPYEFSGGHIVGATNLYSPKQILDLVSSGESMELSSTRRTILVFHCEYSLERGPTLSRFLRSSDRAKNKENYPHLYYPEIYLLHEGYSCFFSKYPELCTPCGYTRMLDPRHNKELQVYRKFNPTSGRKSFML